MFEPKQTVPVTGTTTAWIVVHHLHVHQQSHNQSRAINAYWQPKQLV